MFRTHYYSPLWGGKTRGRTGTERETAGTCAAEAVQDTRAKQEALGRAAQEQLDTLEGAQATIDNGPSAIDNGQWTVDNGQLTGDHGSAEQTGRVDIGDIFKPAGQNKTASTGETVNRGESVGVIQNLRNHIPSFAGIQPVFAVSSQEIRTTDGHTMAEKARTLFEKIKGVVTRQGFGDVEINARSVKDDLSHGVGPAKAAVIPAIPSVIQNGVQIDFQQNWKGRPYDGYVFAAPVTLDGNTVYVAAVVKQTSKNRFYLHEVVDSNGNIIKIDSEERANPTGLAADGDAGTQSSLSTAPIIRQEAQEVKAQDARTGQNISIGDVFRPAQGTAQESGRGPMRAVRPAGRLSERNRRLRRHLARRSAPTAGANESAAADGGGAEQTGRVDIGDIFKPADTGPGLVRDRYTATLDRQLRQEVHDVAKLLGVQVRFVDQVDGGAANAAIRGNEVLIERDNPAPVRALLGHELTHRIQELAPEQYAAFREAALRELGNAREQAEGVQALYRQQGRTLSTEAALDEVAADYAGQLIEDQDLLKRFIRNNQRDRSLLQRLLDAVRSLAEKLTGRWKARARSAQTLLEQAVQAAAETVQTQTGQNESAAREDGAERFSIKYDRDNNPYVVIEEDILDGVPRSEWVKTVKDNLRQKFPNGVTVGNNVININQQSRGEMTFSRYMQRLFNVEPQMYADKLRATNNVDEILRAARNWVNEALLHPRRDDIIDFARGEVLMRIGNNDYIAQVIVGNRGARGLLLYDIINLAETEIRERTKKADAVYTANAQNGPRSRGPASAESSVPQTGDEVKTQFSLKDTDSEGQPLTQEQQEFFRDSKVVDEDGQLLVVYHGTDAEFTIFDRTMGRANMDIQGSFFSPWEDDARGYGGTVEAYYLNLTNPADEGTAYQALRRFQGQNGAGAKARDYLIRQGYDGVNNSGEEYIAFYPEQIKRVDNAAPTADPDIRFSLKGSREMQQAVKELMERTDREAGWTEAEFRREVDQIARRIYGAQVAETKARAEAQAKRARTQRSATQLRRQITRHAGELSQKLRKPTDNRHVPEELRRTAAALLDAINLESAYNVDPETGKRTKNGGGDPVKRTEAFRALKEQYQAIVNDEASEFVVDPNLFGSDAEGIQGNFDKVLKWKDVRLADMNLEQLETVWQVIRAVEKSITTAGKTLTAAKYESTKQWADALAADTATRKDKGSLTRSHASLDLETPLTFFSHYGNAGNQIYRMLRDAQDKQAVLLDQVARAVEQLADRKQVRAWEKETHTFQVEGGELTLTTAQLMDLYELSKRKQAQDHLYRGGIVQPEVRSARIRAGTDGVRVTPGDVADMLSVLTDEQRQAADGLHPDRAVFLRSAAEIQKTFYL